MKESMYILLYDNTFTKRIASSYRHASLLMSVLFDRSVRDSTDQLQELIQLGLHAPMMCD